MVLGLKDCGFGLETPIYIYIYIYNQHIKLHKKTKLNDSILTYYYSDFGYKWSPTKNCYWLCFFKKKLIFNHLENKRVDSFFILEHT